MSTVPTNSHFCFGISLVPAAAGLVFSRGKEAAAGNQDVSSYPGQKWLAGCRWEALGLGDGICGVENGFRVVRHGGMIIGQCSIEVTPETLQQKTLELYSRLLETVHGYNLYRIWNFVPDINGVHAPLMENYRMFCSGRAQAFAAHAISGGNLHRLPAASATGCKGELLTVLFVGGIEPAFNWENPEQIPAYNYPGSYGPHAPSFSRATKIGTGNDEWIFISGTAAIKGSETLFPGDFHAQLPVMLENIVLVLKAVGHELVQVNPELQRHYRVYLRNRDNLCALVEFLERQVLNPGDSWAVVEGDICRRELEVEIELTQFPLRSVL